MWNFIGRTVVNCSYYGEAIMKSSLRQTATPQHRSRPRGGSLLGSIEHIRAGRLRALAVTSAMRSELLPDIPTVACLLSPAADILRGKIILDVLAGPGTQQGGGRA
jgi:hypothetical protein